MCNDYADHVPYDEYQRAFSDLRIRIFPRGGAIPNLEPRDDIHPTGFWRPTEVGAAFTLLTVEPGLDVAPFHNRQIVVLPRDQWGRWIDPEAAPEDLLKPSPAGSFRVERAR